MRTYPLTSMQFQTSIWFVICILAQFGMSKQCEYHKPACTEGTTNKHKPHYVPETKACKGYHVTVDAFLRPGFIACCNAHDTCYGTCNSDSPTCNRVFIECLNQVCAQEYDSPFEKLHCAVIKLLAVTSVNDHGCTMYQKYQQQACTCTSDVLLTENHQEVVNSTTELLNNFQQPLIYLGKNLETSSVKNNSLILNSVDKNGKIVEFNNNENSVRNLNLQDNLPSEIDKEKDSLDGELYSHPLKYIWKTFSYQALVSNNQQDLTKAHDNFVKDKDDMKLKTKFLNYADEVSKKQSADELKGDLDDKVKIKLIKSLQNHTDLFNDDNVDANIPRQSNLVNDVNDHLQQGQVKRRVDDDDELRDNYVSFEIENFAVFHGKVGDPSLSDEKQVRQPLMADTFNLENNLKPAKRFVWLNVILQDKPLGENTSDFGNADNRNIAATTQVIMANGPPKLQQPTFSSKFQTHSRLALNNHAKLKQNDNSDPRLDKRDKKSNRSEGKNTGLWLNNINGSSIKRNGIGSVQLLNQVASRSSSNASNSATDKIVSSMNINDVGNHSYDNQNRQSEEKHQHHSNDKELNHFKQYQDSKKIPLYENSMSKLNSTLSDGYQSTLSTSNHLTAYSRQRREVKASDVELKDNSVNHYGEVEDFSNNVRQQRDNLMSGTVNSFHDYLANKIRDGNIVDNTRKYQSRELDGKYSSNNNDDVQNLDKGANKLDVVKEVKNEKDLSSTINEIQQSEANRNNDEKDNFHEDKRLNADKALQFLKRFDEQFDFTGDNSEQGLSSNSKRDYVQRDSELVRQNHRHGFVNGNQRKNQRFGTNMKYKKKPFIEQYNYDDSYSPETIQSDTENYINIRNKMTNGNDNFKDNYYDSTNTRLRRLVRNGYDCCDHNDPNVKRRKPAQNGDDCCDYGVRNINQRRPVQNGDYGVRNIKQQRPVQNGDDCCDYGVRNIKQQRPVQNGDYGVRNIKQQRPVQNGDDCCDYGVRNIQPIRNQRPLGKPCKPNNNDAGAYADNYEPSIMDYIKPSDGYDDDYEDCYTDDASIDDLATATHDTATHDIEKKQINKPTKLIDMASPWHFIGQFDHSAVNQGNEQKAKNLAALSRSNTAETDFMKLLRQKGDKSEQAHLSSRQLHAQ